MNHRTELDMTSTDGLSHPNLTFTTVTECGPSGNPVVAVEGPYEDVEDWIRSSYAQDPNDEDEVLFYVGSPHL